MDRQDTEQVASAIANRQVAELQTASSTVDSQDASAAVDPQAAGSRQVKEFICIRCPLGCPLKVTLETGDVSEVLGNGCARGKKYAEQEATQPTRTVTALVNVEGSMMPLSCKTAQPIPKELIFDCLDALRGLELHRPIAIGDVVYANVCETGIDVVATKDIN